MSTLEFREKAFLVLFRRFFGIPYHASGENNFLAHVVAQKMGFLLSRRSVYIGDYVYVWDTHGPCSAGLQSLLRNLDQMTDEVSSFYAQYENDDVFFSDNITPLGLFDEDQGKCVSELREKLDIDGHQNDLFEWSELLGSLAFLSLYDMPGSSFDRINKELIHRKPQYSDTIINRTAWDALTNADILYK